MEGDTFFDGVILPDVGDGCGGILLYSSIGYDTDVRYRGLRRRKGIFRQVMWFLIISGSELDDEKKEN